MSYSKPAYGSLGRPSRLSHGLSGPAYRRHQASSAWLGICIGERRRITIAHIQNDSTAVGSGLGHDIFHGSPLSTSDIHGSLPVFSTASHTSTVTSNVISPLHSSSSSSTVSSPGLGRAPYNGSHPPGVTDVGRLELDSSVINGMSSLSDTTRSSSHSTASSSSPSNTPSSSSTGRSRRSTSSFSARYDIPQFPRRGQRWKPGRTKDAPAKQLPDVLSTIEELDELRHGRLGAQQDRYLDAFIQDLLCPRTNTWQLRSEAAPSNTQRLTQEEIERILQKGDAAVARSFADFARAGSITAALQLLKAAVETNHRALPRFSHKHFLQAVGPAGCASSALEFLRVLPADNADARTYNMAMHACIASRDTRTAFGIADLMSRRHVALDSMHVTTLMAVCGTAKDVTRAFQLYADLRQSGARLDGHAYGALIGAVAAAIKAKSNDKKGQLVLLERACDLLEDADKHGVFLEAAAWNALLMCAGRSGQLQRGFDILGRMQQAGAQPDEITFTCLIEGCVLARESDMALKWFRKAVGMGICKSLQLYTAAINACALCQGQELSLAQEVYSLLQRNDVAPDDLLYGNLIALAGRAKALDVAFEFVEDMRASGLKPGNATCSALIYACIQNNNLPAARKVFDTLAERGVLPHISQFNALMEQYALRYRLGTVSSLLGRMVEAGIMPNSNTFRILVLACQRAQQSELAYEVYQVFKSRGLLMQNNAVNNQSILWMLLKACFNRIRESWRVGGYPPTDFPSSRISVELRTPEALQLLAALDPHTRRHNFLDHRDNINWCALALSTYRDFTAAGHKPTIEILDKLLACLRLPFRQQATATEGAATGVGSVGAAAAGGAVGGDGMLHHAQEQQFLRELQREQANVEGALVGLYEVPFDKRALDVVSEAINQGVLPPLKLEQAMTVDMRQYPPSVAEVWAHALMNSLEMRGAAARESAKARRPIVHPVTFLVPPFDPNYVFWPSYVEKLHLFYDEDQLEAYRAMKEAEEAEARRRETAERERSDLEEDGDITSYDDVFARLMVGSSVTSSGSLDSTEEEMLRRRPAAPASSSTFAEHNFDAGAVTGLALAATCRRLKAFAKIDPVKGVLRLEPREINRWIGAKLGYEEEQRKAQKEAAAAGKRVDAPGTAVAAAAAGIPAAHGIAGRPGFQQPGTMGPLGFRGPYGPLGLAAPAPGSLAVQQRNIRMALGGYELPGSVAGAGGTAFGQGAGRGHGDAGMGPRSSSSSSSIGAAPGRAPAATEGGGTAAAAGPAGGHIETPNEHVPMQQQQQLVHSLLPKPSEAGLKRPPRPARGGSPWVEATGGQGSRSSSSNGNGRSGRSSRSSRRTTSSSSGTVNSNSNNTDAGEQEKH